MLPGPRAFGCVAIVLAGLGLAQRPHVRTFDADTPGATPPGLSFAAFRQQDSGPWAIARHADQTFLAHAPRAGRTGWSLALAAGEPLRDVLVSARLRLAGGGAGGLVWRYENAGTFNAVVLDLARGQIAAYRIVRGNRIRFDLEDDLELDPQGWHTVKVVQQDAEVTVSLGGVRVFRDENRHAEAAERGRAGVLAAGEAEAWFDDLRIEPRRSR